MAECTKEAIAYQHVELRHHARFSSLNEQDMQARYEGFAQVGAHELAGAQMYGWLSRVHSFHQHIVIT
jgi:hypothetical protein